MSIKEHFDQTQRERNNSDPEDEPPTGCMELEIFESEGLTFQHCPTLDESSRWADTSEDPDWEASYEKHCETTDTVLTDTGGAASVAYSGPTTTRADETVRKTLLFVCGDKSCECQGKKSFHSVTSCPSR